MSNTNQLELPNHSLSKRLRDANGWLIYVLEDFIEGKTQSVSGARNAERLHDAYWNLRSIETDIRELEKIVCGQFERQ